MKNDLKKVIICDIDNTLSYSKFTESIKNKPSFSKEDLPKMVDLPFLHSTLGILKGMILQGYHILFISIRGINNYDDTKKWINSLGINDDKFNLILNDIPSKKIEGKRYTIDGNRLNSYKIKSIIYDNNVKGKYDVLFALDDDEGCVNMWRYDKGLICYQINQELHPIHTTNINK